MEYSLTSANELFREGSYKPALSGYVRLRDRKYLSPYLDDILSFNIARSEQRLYNFKAGERLTVNNLINYVRKVVTNDYISVEQTILPLASVIVTTYNDVEHLTNSLDSLLMQTYHNLEIVVVDDCSTDSTASIMEEYITKNSRVKYIRLLCNLGTYFAKNVGIKHSTGEYVFFQDSDDISHPDRVLIYIEQFLQQNIKVINCEYARYNSDGNIIRVNGGVSKLGRITLGVHKSVFDEIGFFNCTTKASDDEFYCRIVKYYHYKLLKNIEYPLYYALVREDSLFSDMVEWGNEFNLRQIISRDRQLYLDAFTKLHTGVYPQEFRKYFCFPRIRDAIDVPAGFSKLANPSPKLIICVFVLNHDVMNIVEHVLDYVHQCDKLMVFTNDVSNMAMLLNYENLEIVRCSDDYYYTDAYNHLYSLVETSESFYIITLDTEVIYPLEYINYRLKQLMHDECMSAINQNNLTIELKDIACQSQLFKALGGCDKLQNNAFKSWFSNRCNNQLNLGGVYEA